VEYSIRETIITDAILPIVMLGSRFFLMTVRAAWRNEYIAATGTKANEKEPIFLLAETFFLRDCSSIAHKPRMILVNTCDPIPAIRILRRDARSRKRGRMVIEILIPQKRSNNNNKLKIVCSGGMNESVLGVFRKPAAGCF
jgi:hypothetical protein